MKKMNNWNPNPPPEDCAGADLGAIFLMLPFEVVSGSEACVED